MSVLADVKQGEIYWVEIKPAETVGSEQHSRRPYIIVSRTAVNRKLATVFAVPLTTVKGDVSTYTGPAFRVLIPPQEITRDVGYQGQILLSIAKTDQARVIDKTRLQGRVGTLSQTACAAVGLGFSYLLDLR